MTKSPRSNFKISTVSLPIFLSFAFLVCATGVFSQDGPDAAVELFNNGQDAHAKGDLKTAVELYEKALKILPEFPEAEFQRGSALVSLKRLNEGEKAFRRAIELRDDWTLALSALGAVLVREEKYSDAEPYLAKAISLDRSSFPAYSALVDLKLRTGANTPELKDLLVQIRSFTAKANPTATMWGSQAMLERALGDWAAARRSIERALAIEPNNRTALFERVETALAEGDLTLAESSVKTVEDLATDPFQIKLLRARILIARGNDIEAEKILTSMVPASEAVSKLLAIARANMSQSPEDLEKLIQSSPGDAAILGKLCNVYRVAQPQKALDFCRKASEAEPSNMRHAVGYGAALVQAKRYADAVTLLRRLIAIAPENSSAHANLATALFQLKQYQQAKSEYEWLTAKQPDLVAAYYFLAICHDQLGEYLDAMANYSQFLKLADAERNSSEIEKVNLRLPALQKLVKQTKGKSNAYR